MWHFLITDLVAPAQSTVEEFLPRLPRLEALLARGRVTAEMPSWRHQLLALAGQPWSAEREVPVGAHLAAAAGLPPAAGWAVATPVRCVAGLDHVQLQELGSSLSAALVAEFNATLGGPSGQLHVTPHANLWSFPQPLAVTTHDPAPLVGHDVGPCLPAGSDAAVLRRWMTEAQMWLHGAGEPGRVNSLWPWGVGTAADAASPPSLPWAVEGADPWVAALPCTSAAANAGAEKTAPSVTDEITRVTLWRLADHASAGGAFAAADAAWSDQLMHALRERGAITVWLAGRCHELHAADRWRFWRRWHTPRPWWQ
jgi:hypothetical protein